MRAHNTRGAVKLAIVPLALLALVLLFSGCVYLDRAAERLFPPSGAGNATPVVSPKVSLPPNATAGVNSTLSATPTTSVATATPSATPSLKPSPSPSPSEPVQKYCDVEANPFQAQGPFKAVIGARFFGVDAKNATIKCTPTDSGAEAEWKDPFFMRKCEYPVAFVRTAVNATATALGVMCSVMLVIDTNPDYVKKWSFSPEDFSLTINKSISNTTIQSFTVSNTGTITLTSFSCAADKSFVTFSCLSGSMGAGNSTSFSATFNVASQPVGIQAVTLTIKEADLTKSLRANLNVVS